MTIPTLVGHRKNVQTLPNLHNGYTLEGQLQVVLSKQSPMYVYTWQSTYIWTQKHQEQIGHSLTGLAHVIAH
jgi:hypothetical protein